MRDFNEATRAARERLDGETLSAAESAWLERALRGAAEARPRRRVWVLTGAAAALATVAAVVFFMSRETQTPGGFVVLSGKRACVTALADGVEVLASCALTPRLAVDGAEAELAAGTVLLREQSALRLRRGRATFAVTKRKPGEQPFVVRVSDGAVVVTGTRFTVSQSAEGGAVAVTEGTVELRWADGQVSPVRAGESVVWPRPAAKAEPMPDVTDELETPDAPSPQHGRRTTKAAPPPDANKVLRQLLQLRTQNRTDEALALLREARNNRAYTAVQRERFGFELCNLVTQARGGSEACACWKRHARDFPASARGEQVPEALRKCAK